MNNAIPKLILALACSTLVVAAPPSAAGTGAEGKERAYRPSAEEMILDGLIYRPVSLAGTVIGTGIFIVTLPFSLMGGNVEQAGNTLVVEPARDTFTRCLGCLDQSRYRYLYNDP